MCVHLLDIPSTTMDAPVIYPDADLLARKRAAEAMSRPSPHLLRGMVGGYLLSTLLRSTPRLSANGCHALVSITPGTIVLARIPLPACMNA